MSMHGDFLTLGVDLGGTKVETALVDAGGRILASHKRPTDPGRGPDAVISDTILCIETCLGEAGRKAGALGIGVAGQVSKDTGIVGRSPNLGWHEVDLKTKLEQALGVPVAVVNDVRAATWGEWQHGAGQGVDDLVCLFVGTGVGGGVVSGGRLLEGSTNTAGELGHLTIVSGGRDCHCPNRGCLEGYVGGWAIAKRAQEAARNDAQAGEPLTRLAGGIPDISAGTVTGAYADGDPMAQRLVQETAEHLAAGIVSIVNAFNPRLLLLGGGVIAGLPELVPMVSGTVRGNALEVAVEGLQIGLAALGDKAGVIGAAAVARHKVSELA